MENIKLLEGITGFFGLFPLSSILENREHYILETGSVPVLKIGGGETYSVGPPRTS
jgi:hypothetical protein